MEKLDYALKLIETIAQELLEEKPDPEKIHWVINTARSLRKAPPQ